MQDWGSGSGSLQLGSGGPSSPSPPLWCPTLWMHSLTGQCHDCLLYTIIDPDHGLLFSVCSEPKAVNALFVRSVPQVFLLYNFDNRT